VSKTTEGSSGSCAWTGTSANFLPSCKRFGVRCDAYKAARFTQHLSARV